MRLDASVSSGNAQVGDIVPASVSRDLVVNDQVLARAGTPLRGQVTYVRRSGRFTIPDTFTIRLASIVIDGQIID